MEVEADKNHHHSHESTRNWSEIAGLTAISVGSLALGAWQYRTGVSGDMLGIVSEAAHNAGDAVVHGLRATASFLKGAARKRVRQAGAVLMGVTNIVSLFHASQHTAELADDFGSEQIVATNAEALRPAVVAFAGNLAMAAVGLVSGRKGSTMRGEVADHALLDSGESAVNGFGSLFSPVLEPIISVFFAKKRHDLARRMWRNAEAEHHHGLAEQLVKKVKLGRAAIKNASIGVGYRLQSGIDSVRDWVYEDGKLRKGRVLGTLALSLAGAYAFNKLGLDNTSQHESGGDMSSSWFDFDLSIPDIPDSLSPEVGTPEALPTERPAEPTIRQVIELAPYDSSTGQGTYWHITEQQATQILQRPPSDTEVWRLTDELLRINDKSWGSASNLPVGSPVKLLSPEEARAAAVMAA